MSAKCPMIEKARTEELTTSEIVKALGELADLDGSQSSWRVTLEIRSDGSRIRWRDGDPAEKQYTHPEDALIAAYDDCVRWQNMP